MLNQRHAKKTTRRTTSKKIVKEGDIAKSFSVEMPVDRVCGKVNRFSVPNKDRKLPVDNIYVSHAFLKKNGVSEEGKSAEAKIRVTVKVIETGETT